MVDIVLGLIGTIIYPLFSIFFVLILLIQNLFYGFAGIGNIKFGDQYTNTQITAGAGSVESNTDKGIIYFLLTSGTVRNLFYSLLILALILLVLFTLITFLKNMYSEKPKPFGEIIVNAIKGLASFVLTPVICLFGVWIGNIILQAVHSATSHGANTYMGTEVFVCAAYNANYFRLHDGNNLEEDFNNLKSDYKKFYNIDLGKYEPSKHADYAELVDNLYRDGKLDIALQHQVGRYYNLIDINYIVIIVGSIFMLYALGALTFGAIKRLFNLVFLFVISPIMDSMYPFDEGKAAKGVTADFYKNFVSIYGSVVGLNLFFAILPLIMNIRLSAWDPMSLTKIILLICGLLVVKDLIGTLSGYIGGGNLFNEGTGLMGSVKGQMKKVGGGVGKTVGEFSKLNAVRKTAQQNGERGFSAVSHAFLRDSGAGLTKLTGNVTGIDLGAMAKSAKEGKEAGENTFFDNKGKSPKAKVGDWWNKRGERKEKREKEDAERKEAYQSAYENTEGNRFTKFRAGRKALNETIREQRRSKESQATKVEQGATIDDLSKQLEIISKEKNETARKYHENQLMQNAKDLVGYKGKDIEEFKTRVNYISGKNELKADFDTRNAKIDQLRAKKVEFENAHKKSDGLYDENGELKQLTKENFTAAGGKIDGVSFENYEAQRNTEIDLQKAEAEGRAAGEQIVRYLQQNEKISSADENLKLDATQLEATVKTAMEKYSKTGSEMAQKQDKTNEELKKLARAIEQMGTKITNKLDTLNKPDGKGGKGSGGAAGK